MFPLFLKNNRTIYSLLPFNNMKYVIEFCHHYIHVMSNINYRSKNSSRISGVDNFQTRYNAMLTEITFPKTSMITELSATNPFIKSEREMIEMILDVMPQIVITMSTTINVTRPQFKRFNIPTEATIPKICNNISITSSSGESESPGINCFAS